MRKTPNFFLWPPYVQSGMYIATNTCVHRHRERELGEFKVSLSNLQRSCLKV